jgi:glutamine synthetase
MTPKEFFDFAKKNNAKMVDLKFTDLLGTWQHCSFPIDTWDEGTFVDGVGFDGSSFRILPLVFLIHFSKNRP